jgi:Transglycosylase-like domain
LSAVVRTGLSRYAYQGRHRIPDSTTGTVRSAALGAGVVTAVLAGTAGPAFAGSSGDPWAQLRQCESGGNYSTNTGNGYYGAYQFDIGTWRAYGGSGLPSDASPAEQDRRAKMLYRARGWAPWPACSRKLGLREDPAYGAAGTAPATTGDAAPAPRHKITLSAPATVGAQSVYRITGTSRPHSAVTVKVRAGGYAPWTAYPKKTDARGRYSVAWRARTDYQFQVVGERTSPIRTVRIGTTAAAAPTERLAAGGGGPTVTVAGTGRPRAKVILFVTTATGKWRTWAKLSTDARGRWRADVPAPTKAFRYYAKSANGQRSPVRSLTT